MDELTLLQFMFFGIIIVLVGVLGNQRAIVFTTLLLNGVTAGMFFLTVSHLGNASGWGTLQTRLFPSALLFEWFFAAFALLQWQAYQRTLRDLGQAYEQSRQLETMKDQFITSVNHELRTPITTLDGYVELLHTARTQMSEEEQDFSLAQASKTGKLLIELLENILDVRRIDEHAVLEPQMVHLAAVLEQAQILLHPREPGQANHNIHLEVAPDLFVWGEPIRIQQIVTNLLSNAIKYSLGGSPIIIQTLRVAKTPAKRNFRQGLISARSLEGGHWIEIRVRDFGFGIPREQQSLLFHRFVRLPRDLGSKIPGNGLGLYLCRVFAEAMGGTIHVESSGVPNQGSTFILRLLEASRDIDHITSEKAALITNLPAKKGASKRLYVGQEARPFIATDLQGRIIRLEDFRGRRLLLAFVRFAGCPFCGMRTYRLTTQFPAFQASGLEVLVILESTQEHAREHAVLRDAPFPIVADPTSTLYDLYGTAISSRAVKVALKRRKKTFAVAQQMGFEQLVNGGPAYGDGVLERLPAEFIIGPDFRIEVAHYGRDIGDFLPLKHIERHLQQVASLPDVELRGAR
ncbi:MAG TPA: ATP-binding protein [Ktedonobacterales bacterium]